MSLPKKPGIIAGIIGVLVLGIGVPTWAVASDQQAATPLLSGTQVTVPAISAWPRSSTPTTTPSPSSPQVPSSVSSGSTGTMRIENLSHEAAPSLASMPSTPCTSSDVTATLKSLGPYEGNGTGQFIVALTSPVSCSLAGVPQLAFSNGTASVATSVTRSGGTGSFDAQGPVALGPGEVGSFLLQFAIVTDACPTASALEFTWAGNTTMMNVALNPAVSTLWYACPTTIVSPIEQGDSANR